MKKRLITLLNDFPEIMNIDDETDTDNGYWAYLHRGFIFDNDVHVVHEDTIKGVRESMKRVGPCNCTQCDRSQDE